MPSVKTIKSDGSAGRAVKLNDGIFGVEANGTLVHQVVVAIQNARRQGNAETKTRKEVRGGGAKPFRQKGTGRARQGSSREPHMRGGGTVFGPHRRSYRQKTPVKMKRKALCCALSDRVRGDALSVLDSLTLDGPSTKPMRELFANISPEGRRTLLVTGAHDENALISSRNIPRLIVRTACDINALDILSAHRVVLVKDAVEALEKRLS